jgi:short-subunit dehydrogenase
MRNRELAGAVVVILGASSGLGRAAAWAFAKKGAHLVLAARNAAALEEVADTARLLGVRAVAVPTDAADPQQVQRLAEAAVAFGGRIDVWVNNVGIGAVGGFLETPLEAHEQVVRVNLLSHIYGAHAALPHFLRQGSGVLINTNSVGAWSPSPYAAAYAAGKFGLRGFTESLRGELAGAADIHVCEIYPPFMDTPGLRHGANYSGREIQPPPGVYDPRRAAAAMVRLAEAPRPAVTLGAASYLARFAHLAAPYLMARIMARLFEANRRRARPARRTDGNLFEASREWMSVEGGWSRPGQRVAAGLALAMLVGGAAAGASALQARNGRVRAGRPALHR